MLRGHPCLFLKTVGLRLKIIGRNQCWKMEGENLEGMFRTWDPARLVTSTTHWNTPITAATRPSFWYSLLQVVFLSLATNLAKCIPSSYWGWRMWRRTPDNAISGCQLCTQINCQSSKTLHSLDPVIPRDSDSIQLEGVWASFCCSKERMRNWVPEGRSRVSQSQWEEGSLVLSVWHQNKESCKVVL